MIIKKLCLLIFILLVSVLSNAQTSNELPNIKINDSISIPNQPKIVNPYQEILVNTFYSFNDLEFGYNKENIPFKKMQYPANIKVDVTIKENDVYRNVNKLNTPSFILFLEDDNTLELRNEKNNDNVTIVTLHSDELKDNLHGRAQCQVPVLTYKITNDKVFEFKYFHNYNTYKYNENNLIKDTYIYVRREYESTDPYFTTFSEYESYYDLITAKYNKDNQIIRYIHYKDFEGNFIITDYQNTYENKILVKTIINYYSIPYSNLEAENSGDIGYSEYNSLDEIPYLNTATDYLNHREVVYKYKKEQLVQVDEKGWYERPDNKRVKYSTKYDLKVVNNTTIIRKTEKDNKEITETYIQATKNKEQLIDNVEYIQKGETEIKALYTFYYEQ